MNKIERKINIEKIIKKGMKIDKIRLGVGILNFGLAIIFIIIYVSDNKNSIYAILGFLLLIVASLEIPSSIENETNNKNKS